MEEAITYTVEIEGEAVQTFDSTYDAWEFIGILLSDDFDPAILRIVGSDTSVEFVDDRD